MVFMIAGSVQPSASLCQGQYNYAAQYARDGARHVRREGGRGGLFLHPDRHPDRHQRHDQREHGHA